MEFSHLQAGIFSGNDPSNKPWTITTRFVKHKIATSSDFGPSLSTFKVRSKSSSKLKENKETKKQDFCVADTVPWNEDIHIIASKTKERKWNMRYMISGTFGNVGFTATNPQHINI